MCHVPGTLRRARANENESVIIIFGLLRASRHDRFPGYHIAVMYRRSFIALHDAERRRFSGGCILVDIADKMLFKLRASY